MLSGELGIPPRRLVLLIAGITIVALAVLSWLGWRLIEQDRLLENQQVQQRVERAADLVAAALQRALATDGQRLAAGNQEWSAGAVSFVFREGSMAAYPSGRVAYLPMARPLREPPAAAFAQGEELEFRRGDHAAAAQWFDKIAQSPDPAVRAGALMRSARNLQALGRPDQALAAYARLAEIGGVSLERVPVELAARYARCRLLEAQGRTTDLRVESQRLDAGLRSGQWPLTGPVYWLYTADAARWLGDEPNRHWEGELFAEAIDELWSKRSSMAAASHISLSVQGQPLAILSQSSANGFRALIATERYVASQWLPAAEPIIKKQNVMVAFGPSRTATDRPKVTRRAADTALPWDLAVESASENEQRGAFAQRRLLLVAGFFVLVFMVLLASYLIFRAVSRELAVVRLKSDFVAAVSHEFRTPLTAMRQFTDRLREHPELSEDARRLCYDAQSRATERLTRLVESLLDFGRMEAGARVYRLEPHDCTDLVRRVVEDFRREVQTSGYEIQFLGNGPAFIEADGEALARALWNLLDNAVKYSPDDRIIQVGQERLGQSVAISVRDRGIGIPVAETAAIFSRFHRGEEARNRGIKGTGIGLSMADQIVQAHRGRLKVESEPGQGSTFTIFLPIKD
jgi:signal transduction histidine kinase